MKNIMSIILLFIVIVCHASYGADLVAYYSFDDSGNLSEDNSGNGHNLTLFDATYVAPTYDAAGSVGGASRFNGSTQGWFAADNMYPSGSFSLTTWIKDDGGSTMITQPWSYAGGFQAVIAGDFRFWTFYDTNQYDYVRSNENPTGAWQHIAMTYEVTSGPDASGTYTGTINVYIDGGIVATLAGAQYDSESYYDLSIGRRASAAFNGMIDEFAVWATALSPQQVAALAAKEYTPLNLPEISGVDLGFTYYSFDDEANLSNDDSGNGRDLTIFLGYGTPTYDAAGAVGGASRFDGSTQGWFAADNMYPAGSFSLSTWILDEGGSTMITQPWSYQSGFQAVLAAGEFRFWTLYDLNQYDYVRSYVYSTVNSWQHVAMTYEVTGGPDESGTFTGTIKGYINGLLVATLDGAQYDSQSFNDLAIGRRSTYAFNGLIDEFAVWPKVLTQQQINGLVSKEYTPLNLPILSDVDADINQDGIVNLIDFSSVAKNWLQSSY